MKSFWKNWFFKGSSRGLRGERGVSALEFVLIMVLMAVAILASLDSAGATVEQLMLSLSSELLP